MIQKRTNVLELETQPAEQPAEICAKHPTEESIPAQTAIAKAPAAQCTCSFRAVKLSGTIKRKIVISTISKVLLDSAKKIMPDFSTKQIIESALASTIKLASPEQFNAALKEIELNKGEIQ